jgi:hypothetical protein
MSNHGWFGHVQIARIISISNQKERIKIALK